MDLVVFAKVDNDATALTASAPDRRNNGVPLATNQGW